MWNTVFGTIIGGLLAILGGYFAALWQVKNARKIKMREVAADRTVSASADAYAFIKEVSSLVARSETEKALRRMVEKERWFFRNRLFLPGQFPDKWLTVRNWLAELRNLEGGAAADPVKIGELKGKLGTRGGRGDS